MTTITIDLSAIFSSIYFKACIVILSTPLIMGVCGLLIKWSRSILKSIFRDEGSDNDDINFIVNAILFIVFVTTMLLVIGGILWNCSGPVK